MKVSLLDPIRSRLSSCVAAAVEIHRRLTMGPFAKRALYWVLVGGMATSLLPLACGSDPAPKSPAEAAGGAGGRAGEGGTSSGASAGQLATAGMPSEGGAGGASGGEPNAGQGGGGAPSEDGEAGAGGGPIEGPLGASFPRYPDVSFPTENPFSSEKAVLGKILFWDEQLSSDNTVACGTCHRAGAGGSDPRGASPSSRHPGASADPYDDVHGAQGIKRCSVAGSTVTYKADATFGLKVQITKRRPPSYLDAMFAPDVFWDGRAKSKFIDPDTNDVAIASGGGLESQSVGPPLNDSEMACEARTWTLIHQKLQTAVPLSLARDLPPDMKAAIAARPSYPKLFEAAFGTTEITTKRIAFAIATHERRLTSNETPWDKFNAGDTTALSGAERRGLELFVDKGKCTACHAPPLFTDFTFHNLGFIHTADFDKGRQEVTKQDADTGKVKTPTLRNVGLREPAGLLHYGFGPGANLEAVMAAYNEPPNVDTLPAKTDAQIERLDLSDDEISDMVDFMRHALTDPRVAAELPPFDRPKLGSEP